MTAGPIDLNFSPEYAPAPPGSGVGEGVGKADGDAAGAPAGVGLADAVGVGVAVAAGFRDGLWPVELAIKTTRRQTNALKRRNGFTMIAPEA